MLRYQDQVCLPGDSRPQREVAGMPAHHLDDLHPTMRSGRRARTLKHFGNVAQCGIETECVISTGEILVDRFRHADDANTALGQLRSDTHSVFAATNDECFELKAFDVLYDFLRSIVCFTF